MKAGETEAWRKWPARCLRDRDFFEEEDSRCEMRGQNILLGLG